MDECLILSCSARKRRAKGAAIDLYDGNLFRIARRHQPNIPLFILSAKYGLIEAAHEIEIYDQALIKKDERFVEKIRLQAQ